MLIEHTVPDTVRMAQLPDDTLIRIWLDVNRFVTIRAVNHGKEIQVQAYQAPGGHSYTVPVRLQTDSFGSLVIV